METKRVVESLINTAKDSIEAKSYYSGLGILLMIPEIIVGNNDAEKYINWCDKNIKNINNFDGTILYKFKKELFFGPNKNNSYISKNISIYEAKGDNIRFSLDVRNVNKTWDTYASNIDSFVENFIDGVESYIQKNL